MWPLAFFLALLRAAIGASVYLILKKKRGVMAQTPQAV
jgi:hypothetical protein